MTTNPLAGVSDADLDRKKELITDPRAPGCLVRLRLMKQPGHRCER